jgi:hypothetical protein
VPSPIGRPTDQSRSPVASRPNDQSKGQGTRPALEIGERR